jgi:antitoxin MazE
MGLRSRIRIGKNDSTGFIRIPHTLLKQAGLTGEVDIVVEGDKLVIRSARRPRQGWDEKFAEMAEMSDDRLFDQPVQTLWDEDEWT